MKRGGESKKEVEDEDEWKGKAVKKVGEGGKGKRTEGGRGGGEGKEVGEGWRRSDGRK